MATQRDVAQDAVPDTMNSNYDSSNMAECGFWTPCFRQRCSECASPAIVDPEEDVRDWVIW